MAIQAIEYQLRKDMGLPLDIWPTDREILEEGRDYFRTLGISGLIVTCDRKKWSTYFNENLYPKLEDQFEILNMSDRRYWEDNPTTRLYFRYCWLKGHSWPVVVLVPTNYVRIFDFEKEWIRYSAGDQRPIKRLENEILAELQADR